jgi:putative oxidoreductase
MTSMTISRRLARPMLASMFVAGGLDALRNPESKVKAADAVVGPLTEIVPSLPDNTETFVRVNGAIQVGAGVLLAVGKFRRLAALALIGSIIPTTYAGHRFWDETDEGNRAQQRIHFFKNLGLLGGLILEAVDTEGAPSLGWRARRQGRRVGHAVAAGRLAGEAAIAHGTGASSTGRERGDQEGGAKAHETAQTRPSRTPRAARSSSRAGGRRRTKTAAKLEPDAAKAAKTKPPPNSPEPDAGRPGRPKVPSSKPGGRAPMWPVHLRLSAPVLHCWRERAGPYLTTRRSASQAGAERAGEFLTAGTERAGEFRTRRRTAVESAPSAADG